VVPEVAAVVITTGFIEKIQPATNPLVLLVALKVTFPVNPFSSVTVSVIPGASLPVVAVAVAEEGVREKSAAEAEVMSMTTLPLEPAKVESPE